MTAATSALPVEQGHAADGHDACAPAPAAPSVARRITRNVAWTLASDLAGRGASLWLALFCARVLPVAGFGLFALGQGVAQYAWVFGDAVVNNGYATREIARAGAGRDRLASQLYTLRVATGALLTALLLAAAFLLPLDPAWRAVLAAASLYCVCYASLPDWLARGLERFRELSLANLVIAAATVALSVMLLAWRADPALAAAAWAGSFAVGSLVLLPLLASGRGPRLALDAGAWRPHVGRSTVFSLGAIAAMGITLLPVILLGALSTAREVGLFAAGFRLVTAIMGLGAVLWWPIYPVLAKARRHSLEFREVLEPFLTLMLAISLPAALALGLFARELVTGLFGAGYADAAPALAVLAVALPLQFLASVLEVALLATGGEAPRARINAVALAVSVAVALALVPRHGALGAALAFGLAIAVLLGGYLLAMGRSVSARWLATSGRGLTIAALALAAFWLVAQRAAFPGAWASLALGAAFYAALVAGLRIVPFRRARAYQTAIDPAQETLRKERQERT